MMMEVSKYRVKLDMVRKEVNEIKKTLEENKNEFNEVTKNLEKLKAVCEVCVIFSSNFECNKCNTLSWVNFNNLT